MACRSNRQSAIADLWRFNPWISAGVLLEVGFILAVIYLPALHQFFTSAPFAPEFWVLICVTPLLIFFVEELRKLLVRRGVKALGV